MKVIRCAILLANILLFGTTAFPQVFEVFLPAVQSDLIGP
jgi:hypothetical protein